MSYRSPGHDMPAGKSQAVTSLDQSSCRSAIRWKHPILCCLVKRQHWVSVPSSQMILVPLFLSLHFNLCTHISKGIFTSLKVKKKRKRNQQKSLCPGPHCIKSNGARGCSSISTGLRRTLCSLFFYNLPAISKTHTNSYWYVLVDHKLHFKV